MPDAMSPVKNYDLTEITRLLLKMRDNCVRNAEGEAYDDPGRKEKYEALEAAIDLINNPSMLQRWINVKDRLPDNDDYYLTYTTEHTCEVYRYDGDGEWVTAWDDTANHDITHWMPLPLPEPPEEEE